MRPRSINFFEMLGFTAAGLGVLRVLIALIMMGSTRPAPLASQWFGQFFLLLLFVGIAAVTWMVSRKRHDVARGAFYVVAAMTGLALLQGFGSLGTWEGSLGILFNIIDLLTFGALLGAGIALYRPEAAAHMVPGGIKTSPTPGGNWGNPGAGAGQGYPPVGGYPPAVPPAQGSGYGTHGAADQTSSPVWHDSPTQGVGYPPPGESAGMSDPAPGEATRRCPYCAETIRAEATKCRFCGSQVEPAPR